MKTGEIRVFRIPYWSSIIILVGLVVSVTAVIWFISNGNIDWSLYSSLALSLLFALGLADALSTYVRINPNELILLSNFHRKTILRSEIHSVSWSAGCPVTLELSSGQIITLPPVANNVSVANCIRAWLKTHQ